MPQTSVTPFRDFSTALGTVVAAVVVHALPIGLMYGVAVTVVQTSWLKCTGVGYISREMQLTLIALLAFFVTVTYVAAVGTRFLWRRSGQLA